MSDYKVYIGAIEIRLDDALYEIGLRELCAGGFLGTWECTACRICGVAKEARNGRDTAIALAKQEAISHHEELHNSKRLFHQAAICRDETASTNNIEN